MNKQPLTTEQTSALEKTQLLFMVIGPPAYRSQGQIYRLEKGTPGS